jgi:hypothetical protein
MEVKNWKAINKNTLQGTFDLEFVKLGLVIKGCMWHISSGRDWIAFPSREYQLNGEKRYQSIVEWKDKDIANRFFKTIAPMVKDLSGR